MNSWQKSYDTGWINRNDWTNVHLGSSTTKNADSNVEHNLNTPLSKLLVKVFISTDDTDANSFEIGGSDVSTGAAWNAGYTVFQIDVNNIKIQTGVNGLNYLDDDGAAQTLGDWYYKVKVWYLG